MRSGGEERKGSDVGGAAAAVSLLLLVLVVVSEKWRDSFADVATRTDFTFLTLVYILFDLRA